MDKKETAVKFLRTIVARRIDEAYDRYTHPNFIHHNQHSKGDRESLREAMREAHDQFPDTKIDVRHVYQDGETVIVHSLVELLPGGPSLAVVHIARFEGDKIAEFWDLGQEIVANSPNQRGPF